MYDNIGGKIKGLAIATFIVEAIATVITGIVIMVFGDKRSISILGLLVIVVGPIFAWISSWLLYGIGELIDKTCDIERNTHSIERKSGAQANVVSERVNRIEKLRSQGLITEEEYQQAVSKKLSGGQYE